MCTIFTWILSNTKSLDSFIAWHQKEKDGPFLIGGFNPSEKY
jgi:hypothetical protein